MPVYQLRPTQARMMRPSRPILTDLPHVLICIIINLVAMPRISEWGVKLECLFDIVGSLDAIMRSCTSLLHAVSRRTWSRALFYNRPRIQASWNVLPHNHMWYEQWKSAVLRYRGTAGTTPAWAASFSKVNAPPRVHMPTTRMRLCARSLATQAPLFSAHYIGRSPAKEQRFYVDQPFWPIHLWFLASKLDTVTAGGCGDKYRLLQVDRAMLPYQVKRTGPFFCRLYKLPMVLKVARLKHLEPCAHANLALLRKICIALNLRSSGRLDQLRTRLIHHLKRL